MTITKALVGAALLFGAVSGQATSTPGPTGTAASPAATITSVSDCHNHGTTQYCVAGDEEYAVATTPSAGETLPTAYSGCHNHGSELYCLTDDGGEVQLLVEGATASEESADDSASGELNCHFHAGVEHCVGAGASEGGAVSCERRDREYDIPLRIGLIFAILAASAIGSFGPVFLTSLTKMNPHNVIFTILKQFGTGVIISTAFVHLYTHATLMFESDCLGELKYEATTSAIVMAGLLISYIIEYLGRRLVMWRQSKQLGSTGEGVTEPEQDRSKEPAASTGSSSHHMHHGFGAIKQVDKLSVVVLEAGLVFHSVLIGVTLVVAGDSFFLTLFAVIFFHQMFEGIALGTRIAELPASQISFLSKMIMAATFAISTPLGMAIGTGVLSSYNGNDPATIIAIGTLDAFSAGILVWVGVVEMWAEDWLHGDLATSGPIKTGLAFFALIVGMILMSVLGKWA